MNNAAEIRDLYRELILDHARAPRNFGKLEESTHAADGINPLCGDKLHIYLRIVDGRIDDMRFEGSGCAISVASASLLTEIVVGLPVESAGAYFKTVTTRLTRADSPAPIDDDKLEKLIALEGVRDYPSRVKCATLAWHALHAALSNSTAPATTE